MTPEEFNRCLAELRLHQGAAAEFLGLNIRTVNSYANGARIPQPVAMLLRAMVTRSIPKP